MKITSISQKSLDNSINIHVNARELGLFSFCSILWVYIKVAKKWLFGENLIFIAYFVHVVHNRHSVVPLQSLPNEVQ